MIDSLLPDSIVTVETTEELVETELFPEEEAAVGQPVEKRRHEFVTGRACARRALERLGVAPVPIGAGARGEPLWPDGIVGSITHCSGFRACAVARTADVESVGIDAEVHAPLPEGVLEEVASPVERQRLSVAGEGTDLYMDRVLFSAKESVYKAWFPLTGSWLGFEDVDMTFEVATAAFHARLLVPGPRVGGSELRGFDGRWRRDGGVLGTAVVVARG